MSIISYAQNFEDVMLWRALGHIPGGFYVDIGAHDPVIDSVSLAFYEAGWRGINVDASPSCAEKLQAARPEDINIHSAISDREGYLTFYSLQEDGNELGISSCDSEIVQKYLSRGLVPQKSSVPAITLDGLFNQISQSAVHWLKVDVEGFERKVLEGWQHSPVRPWIVIIESTKPASEERNHSEWESLILEKGYQFVYFDGLNRFYVSGEHPELAKKFDHPPCVYDGFIASCTSTNTFSNLANGKVRQLEKSLSQEKDEKAVISFELAQSKNQITESEAKIELLEKEKNQISAKLVDSDIKVALAEGEKNQISIKLADVEKQASFFHERTSYLEAELTLSEGEISRLKRLLYSSSVGNHLYRAWEVLLGNPYYRRPLPPKAGHLHVAWHTHIYRALRTFFAASDKAWHTHIYRAWRSLGGDSRFSPQSGNHPVPEAVNVVAASPAHPTAPIQTSSPSSVSFFGAARRNSGV